MRVHYINCFNVGDPAGTPLSDALDAWQSDSRRLVRDDAVDGNQLRARIDRLWQANDVPDVLIVGGHGHPSLSGFSVRNDAVRWHDLAFLLREQTSGPWTFVFYSCNGGYPGIMHAFGRANGLDFVFGPRIEVAADAMTHATMEIISWKEGGGGDFAAAKALVDQVNTWGIAAHGEAHAMFLRVMWAEGSAARHPNAPNTQRPIGDPIPLREWGLG
ncbi:hypothetical protein WMF39_40720 [Sorangium sp. So ce1504]|uniref:hypothetical protein n=1 Tax=Sorangium sp. So ce1504 TaxID=3133337 RepID=UPI003F5E677E